MKGIREAGALVFLALTLCATATAPTFAAEPATGSSSEQAKSADEIARELANPNNSLASLTFKNQYRSYVGDLPNADKQGNYTQLFQPVFPFPLADTESGGKANLFIRPGIPLLVNQPVFDPSKADFNSATALGDIGFDIGYGVTEKSGVLWAFGILQGETIESVIQRVKEIINDERVKVTDISASVNPSPISDAYGPEYKLMEKTIRQTWGSPDLLVSPLLVIGGADAKWFHNSIAKNVYRLTAVRVESAADVGRLHGVNERVLVDEYAKSIGFYHQFLANAQEL